MKRMEIITSIVVVFITACAICDESAEFARALNAGADAKMTLRIVNADGVPIPDAEVEFGFWNNYSQGGFKNSILRSNTNGECVVSGQCNGSCVWNVTKPGYYRSHAEWSLSNTQSAPKVLDGKWQPYGATREIVLSRLCKMPVCREHRAA